MCYNRLKKYGRPYQINHPVSNLCDIKYSSEVHTSCNISDICFVLPRIHIDSNKLVYFETKFETICDGSACHDRPKRRMSFLTSFQSKLIFLQYLVSYTHGLHNQCAFCSLRILLTGHYCYRFSLVFIGLKAIDPTLHIVSNFVPK